MGLEFWDIERRKWVLYRDQDEHSDDCARHPFEDVPKRIFLDTNVVNLLVKYAEQVFEQVPIQCQIDRTRALNIEALMHVFTVGARASWDVLASRKTLDEIDQTPNPCVRASLLNYAIELVEPQSEQTAHAARLGRRLTSADLFSTLPDTADRELIGNAIGLGCDAFCTCDLRTIIRNRERLPQLPLHILTPLEWWARVRPWAGLWC